jgi:hypothetical protein
MGDRQLNEENQEENEKLLKETYTEFPAYKGGTAGQGSGLSRFFYKFFAGISGRGRPKKAVDKLSGDVVKSAEVVPDEIATPSLGVSRSYPQLPQIEFERRRKYSEYENMDNYPEIMAALDIYADDSTQKTIEHKVFEVKAKTQEVEEVVDSFLENVRLRDFIWDITRNVAKYGDCFIENILDLNNPRAGIQRIKVLNPNFIIRKENEYGYLKGFMQEVPDRKTAPHSSPANPSTGSGKFLQLDKEQITHFRIHTSDPNYYPYGKSILAASIQTYKSLKMMEDAMLIYRLSRAPERRIFYVDVGNLPTTKVETFIERMKQKFKKEKFWDASQQQVSERYNPLSTDEDFFVPTRNNSGTKIDTLPGAQNLGEVDDVKYFRDKLLASLKIPKDYIVEKDQSPERKANLSQLDVKFARAITRLQREIEIGLETLAKRHLALRNFPASLMKGLEIRLCPPSDMFEKRRLELDEQKFRVVQAAKGLELFSNKWLYETYFSMTTDEIKEIESDKEADMDKQNEMMGGMEGGMPGAPMPPGAEGEPGMEGEEAPDEEPV